MPEPAFTCPLPIASNAEILLGHGGGGRLTQQLIENLFLPVFRNPHLETRHDGAVLEVQGTRLAYTTDSYVVRPLFFPGGNIGDLAVNGTVNDLAMCGARPLYLSAGFILEEGLSIDTLRQIVQSMQQAAAAARVQLVCGDTKVVDRGKCDGIFINTSGIGIIEHTRCVAPASIRPGDLIVLNGDIGRHGIAIMAAREGLALENAIASDTAPLARPILELLAAGIDVHCMRDLTRGGLAGALVEIAETAGATLEVTENAISVREDIHAVCEILGLDPMHVANEGRFIAFVPADEGEQALRILSAYTDEYPACIIGHVHDERSAQAMLRTRIGTLRIIDMLSGEQLPRIC